MSKKGRKTASFCLHHPTPEASIAQLQEGTSQLERAPSPGEEELGKQPATPSSRGAVQTPSFGFTPAPHSDQQNRHIEAAAKGKEKQRLLLADTQWEHL